MSAFTRFVDWIEDTVSAVVTLATTDIIPIIQGSTTKRTTLQAIANWIIQTALSFTQSGTGPVSEPVQTSLRRWCWAEQYGAVGDGVADDSAAIVRGWTAGHMVVRLMRGKNYKLDTGFTRTAGQKLVGEGKSTTTITLGADIVLWDVASVNDTGLEDLLIVPYTSQTNPVIRLTAATATITRNNFKGLQIAGTTQDYRPIQCRSTGAFGVWANNFEDISCSGVGTVVELNTSDASAWIRQNRFEKFYVNDFIIGVDFIRSAGDGGNENTFRDWAAQASARTTHGFRIPDSSSGQNQYNVFDQFNVYDLTSSGVYYDIGTGVIGTEVRTHSGQDLPTTSKFIDRGVRTKHTESIRFAAEILGHGHVLQIPTASGWTSAVTGSGSTTQQAAYNSTRTGTTLNSTARLYTETIGGFASTSPFAINYDKPLIFRFNLSRITSEPNAVGRIQLKTVQTEGALAADGLGIRVSNFALYGESFSAAAGGFVDLSTTLTDTANDQIEIRHYPADRVEWWVNGVYKAQQSTAANIPSGTKSAYLVHSLVTTVSNPSGDAQMLLMQPWLWVDL